jgi:HlyD family secretion protein
MPEKQKKLFALVLVVAGLAALLLALWFFSGDRVPPGRVQPPEKDHRPEAETVEADVRTVTEWYDAVGTIIPRTRATVEAQVRATVTAVPVEAGETFAQGDLLVRLDDTQLKARSAQAHQSLQSATARREQARQGLHAAKAAFEEVEKAYQRIERFHELKAATEQDLEQIRSRFLQARAAVQHAQEGFSAASADIGQAREMVREAEIYKGYAQLTAPVDGEVLERLVDPGDMAMPGKPLLLLRTARGLQIEATVRENLVSKVRLGDIRPVRLTTLNTTVDAVIDRIVPFIDPRTRTFLVKADLPEIEGAFPGMYGKLMIPHGEVDVVVIPPRAVRRVGQLELVTVQTPEGWQRRYIKTGGMYDGLIEVLSGLQGGEKLLIGEPGDDGR